jgi:hypothetical protein
MQVNTSDQVLIASQKVNTIIPSFGSDLSQTLKEDISFCTIPAPLSPVPTIEDINEY